MSYYLDMEIGGIKSYVFASSKLKYTRGGSAVLDLFNRQTMPAVVEKNGGTVVFAGGGHCLASMPSRTGAETAGADLERILARRTEGQARLAWGVAPHDPDFQKARRAYGEDRARRFRDSVAGSPPPLPPFVALCQICSRAPAVELADEQERHPVPLCRACLSRRSEMGDLRRLKPDTIWQRIRLHMPDMSREAYEKAIPDGELEALVAQTRGKHYLAYLYCDGNAMGRTLDGLHNEGDFRKFSQRVDESLHKAVAEAIFIHCHPGSGGGSGEKGDRFGAEVLLLGGDDLIVVARADRAIDLVDCILESFHRHSQGQLVLSAGLVFASHDTPVPTLQAVAEKLLKSAKRRAYLDESQERPLAKGYVDFQEITSFQSDVEREYAVTCRPYRLEEFGGLVARTRAVKEVPRGHLYALMEALHGSEREAATMTQLVVGRRRESERDALIAALTPPWLVTMPLRPSPYFEVGHPRLAPSGTYPYELYGRGHRWSPIPEIIELLDHVGRTEPGDG